MYHNHTLGGFKCTKCVHSAGFRLCVSMCLAGIPMVEMSTSSTIMLPCTGSTIRNKAWINVDFPLPVRPTIPTLSPLLILQLTPSSTIGEWALYRTWHVISPTLNLFFTSRQKIIGNKHHGHLVHMDTQIFLTGDKILVLQHWSVVEGRRHKSHLQVVDSNIAFWWPVFWWTRIINDQSRLSFQCAILSDTLDTNHGVFKWT